MRPFLLAAVVAVVGVFVQLNGLPEYDVLKVIGVFRARLGEPMPEGVAGEEAAQYRKIVTDFYDKGWAQTYHFSHWRLNEGYGEALHRHQDKAAVLLEAGEGKKVLEVGTGVGAAARQVARTTGAAVTGVTPDNYERQRAERLALLYEQQDSLQFVQAEPANMTFAEDASFDAAFSIESISKEPSPSAVYKEVFRLLKKGGVFAVYEFVTTPAYDSENATHRALLKELEHTAAMPPIRSPADVRAAATKAGFELVSDEDVALDTVNTFNWWERIDLYTVQHLYTMMVFSVMELIGTAERGTLSTHGMLRRTSQAIIAAGKEGIITPMHLFVMRKP